MFLSMSVSSLVLLVASVYAVFVLIRSILDPLRRVPGPFFARYTRLWYLYKIYQGDFEKKNIELHARFGPVVRIAPNEYSIDDVSAAKTIYGHGNTFVKAPWYKPWAPPDPHRASLFAIIDPQYHSAQRRKVASAYSMSSIVGYEGFIDNCSSLMVARFEKAAQAGKRIDIGHWFQCYAFDVIGEITFGKRFGFLDAGEDEEGVFNGIDARTAYGTFVGVFPFLHQLIFSVLPKQGGHGFVGNFCRAQISSREAQYQNDEVKAREGSPDFVSKFLAIRAANPDKMTPMDIFTTCNSNIGAGSDTTAISLSSILYHLLKYPSTFKRLQAEIDAGLAAGSISNPITFKEANQLPYLQAVIKEGLRLHSATGLPLARLVPQQGCTIAGLEFPGGATVGINSWVAHHNQSIYGADAHVWRPDRWLEIQEEGRGAEVEKYFFAFGMGSRTCVGKNVSLIEMSKLIPQLVSRFDFKLDEEVEKNGWRTRNTWFVKPENFYGRVVKRNSKGEALSTELA